MSRRVSFSVNGTRYERDVEPRLALVDLLRDELHLTGTNIGCEQGVCGACTVLVDGRSVLSCLMLTSTFWTSESEVAGPASGSLAVPQTPAPAGQPASNAGDW